MNKDCSLGMESLERRVVLSNDPLASNQWYLSAIQHDNVAASNSPVVAVIDSGLDLNHIDLKSNVWVNVKEIPNDGRDNDNNGYVDDIHGWNFVDNNNNVQDNFYHGTHIAGIIGASYNNGIGIAGIAPSVKIMPLKFQNDKGLGYTGAAISAISYAIRMKTMGVNIAAINLSFGGGTSYSTTFANCVKRASDNNIVVVIAAGNNGSNNDILPRYPSSYKYANTISVAAVNSDLTVAAYSNYGKNSVDIASPGSDVLSTLPGNNYGRVSGSSMATAVVSGAVGLLKSINTGYSASQIKQALLNGASKIYNIVDKVSSGLLNIKNSVTLLKNTVPSLVYNDPVVSAPKASYSHGMITANKSFISGWARDNNNSSNKLIVEVSVNGVVRYSQICQQRNNQTGAYDAFEIKMNKKYFTKKSNLVAVTIKDSSSSWKSVIYSGYVKK